MRHLKKFPVCQFTESLSTSIDKPGKMHFNQPSVIIFIPSSHCKKLIFMRIIKIDKFSHDAIAEKMSGRKKKNVFNENFITRYKYVTKKFVFTRYSLIFTLNNLYDVKIYTKISRTIQRALLLKNSIMNLIFCVYFFREVDFFSPSS